MGAYQSQGQASSLEELARARFSPLSAAELTLVRAAPKAGGGMAHCGPSNRDDDVDNDPSRANGKDHAWGKDRHIRAKLIRWLCVDRSARNLSQRSPTRCFRRSADEPFLMFGSI
jgi:hypothetical protein